MPPVVITTRAPAAIAALIASPTGSPSGTTTGGAHLEPERGQLLDDQRAGRVLVDPGRRPVGRDHHVAAQARSSRVTGVHSPDLPPLFDSTRMSVITLRLSTALTMSITVSAATETAVSASISTPVRSVVRGRA